MEKSLTKIKDVDLKILSELDDTSLLNFCKSGKYGRELCLNEDFWRNRVLQKYPKAFPFKSPEKTWKNYYLSILYYLNGFLNFREGYYEAIRHGRKDIVEFLLAEKNFGLYPYFHTAIQIAGGSGHKDLLEFFISKLQGQPGERLDNYDLQVAATVAGGNGHLDMLKLLMTKGSINLNQVLYYAAAASQREIIDFLISQGANDWKGALIGARQGNHPDLVRFFENKIFSFFY